MATDTPSAFRKFLAAALVAPFVAAFVYVAGFIAHSWLRSVLNMELGNLLLALASVLAARCLFNHVLAVAGRAPDRERAIALWRSAAVLAMGFGLSAWALQRETTNSTVAFALLCGAMTTTFLGLLGGHYWRGAAEPRAGGWYAAAHLVPMLMPAALLVCVHGLSPLALIAASLHPGAAEYTFVGTFVQLTHLVSELTLFVRQSLL